MPKFSAVFFYYIAIANSIKYTPINIHKQAEDTVYAIYKLDSKIINIPVIAINTPTATLLKITPITDKYIPVQNKASTLLIGYTLITVNTSIIVSPITLIIN